MLSPTAPRDILAERLRYIDITFECLERARRIVNRVDGWGGPKFPDELPSNRSDKIGHIMGRLRAKQCAREGIPNHYPAADERTIATASESTVPTMGKAA